MRAALGEDHPDAAQSANNLAVFYYSIGDYAKAETLYRKALETLARDKSPDAVKEGVRSSATAKLKELEEK